MSDGNIFLSNDFFDRPEGKPFIRSDDGISHHEAPFIAVPVSPLTQRVAAGRCERLKAFVQRSVLQLLKVSQRECGGNIPEILDQAALVQAAVEKEDFLERISSYSDQILAFQKTIYERVRGTQRPPRLEERICELKVHEKFMGSAAL